MNSKLAVVTGASGALGKIVVKHFKARGMTVIGIDFAACGAADGMPDLFYGNVDLANKQAVELIFGKIKSEGGSISALANIAGGFDWQTLEGGDTETWDRLWAMNVKSCLHACQAALPCFSSDGGAIVNVSAAATSKAGLGMAAYTATKSGVSRLTESLAEELKPRSIRVNAVLPTIMDTPANRANMPGADPNEWVTPQELAQVIGFLASPEASGINSALLPVSGRL